MNPKFELQNLLNGELPLDKVGPRLRNDARRAVRTGDIQRMRMVAKVIISELLRRGDLLRLAMDPETPFKPSHFLVKSSSRLLDLSSVGEEYRKGPKNQTKGRVASAQDGPGLVRFNHLLGAMKDAQELKVGDPDSNEVGTILESILELLEKLTPQFQLRILLFDETDLNETQGRVFSKSPLFQFPSWIAERATGQSTFLPSANSLPPAMLAAEKDSPQISAAFAIPLFGPPGVVEDLEEAREVGLLFLLARNHYSRDSAFRLGINLSKFITHSWNVHKNLNEKIHIDSLTGLFNRRFFDGHFPLLLERAKRNRTFLSLIVADIDFFKTINTDYGLMVGDQVLQMVARRLKEEVRKVDVVCRRGGEEFNIILPDTDFEAAREVITRLLNAPFELMTNWEEQTTLVSVNLSFGVSIFPDNGSDDQQLHTRAEFLMFLSKDKGRNRCHYWRNDGNHLEQQPT